MQRKVWGILVIYMKSQHTFSVRNVFSRGWTIFKKRPIFNIIYIVVAILVSQVPLSIFGDKSALGNIFSLALLPVTMGLLFALGFSAVRDISFSSNDAIETLKKKKPLFWPLLGLIVSIYIAIGIASIPGFLFLFIFLPFAPFMGWGMMMSPVAFIGALVALACVIYVAMLLMFAPYVMYDKQEKHVFKAMKQSYVLARGSIWKLLEFIGFSLVLNFLGAIPFGLGLFVTIPVTLFAQFLIYEALSGSKYKEEVIEIKAEDINAEAEEIAEVSLEPKED